MMRFATTWLVVALTGASPEQFDRIATGAGGDAAHGGVHDAVAADSTHGATTRTAAPRGVQVIAHPGLSADTLSREQVSRVFLKKFARWDDGRLAIPVDLAAASPVRAAFTREVHRRSVDAVKRYWRQQIYSAREVPPPDRSSEAEVLAFVRATPGAVGYVSADVDLDGVKPLTVVDR